MRILLTIHHQLDAGAGAPGVTLALRDAYRAAGHDAQTLSFDDMPAWTPPRARELLFPEFVAARLAARGRDFDVVDASTGDAWLWARMPRRPLLVCRLHGLEHVFWEQERLHDPPLTTRLYHGGLRLREVAAALRGSDACFFLNAAERELATTRLGVRPENGFVVRNGIPAEMLGLPRPRPPEGPLRIAHVGSYTQRKGVRHLARAVSAVLRRRADAAITYLGTREPAERVLARHEAAVRERVRVVESYERGDLPDLLAGHHVLVSASLAEGFSLALPEAMACGLAPVVTALPGAREIVEHDRNGILLPPGDAAALEQSLEALFTDGARLQRLREAAQAAVQRLGWPEVAAAQLELYARLLRRRVAKA